MSYLQWELKKEDLVDLPCYSSPAIQKDFRERIWQKCKKSRWESSDEDTEIVKIMAPLTDNLNSTVDEELEPYASHYQGLTPIHEAAIRGHTDYNGLTPIYRASLNRHTEIVNILAALTDNPNAPSSTGLTPIMVARNKGCMAIQKILQKYT